METMVISLMKLLINGVFAMDVAKFCQKTQRNFQPQKSQVINRDPTTAIRMEVIAFALGMDEIFINY